MILNGRLEHLDVPSKMRVLDTGHPRPGCNMERVRVIAPVKTSKTGATLEERER
jgi:hypothetical protein